MIEMTAPKPIRPSHTTRGPICGTQFSKGVNDGLLRLEHRKCPVKTIVVDHVEKLPTAN